MGGRVAVEALADMVAIGAVLAVPLAFERRLVGFLALGEKRSGRFYSTEDLDLLREELGLTGVKEAKVAINGLEVGVAVVNSLKNARKLLEVIKAGRKDLHFIEVMTCPGGCIGGGGQPIGADMSAVRARMMALYAIDRADNLRVSHKNEWVLRLYKEFLGEPLGHKSHELLHTTYEPREPVM